MDKLEMLYQSYKEQGLDQASLDSRAKIEKMNANTVATREKESKDEEKVALGKLNYKISKLEEKENLTDTEKIELEEAKAERQDIIAKKKHQNSKEAYESKLEKLEKKEKDQNLREGFVKNHEKIDRILEYRDKLKEELEKNKTQKAQNDAKLEQLGKSIDLEVKVEKLKIKIDLASKPDSELTNDEYVALLQELKENEAKLQEAKELETKNKTLAKRIKSNQMAVTKCNLAWKNLFRNKSWDDIHLKAVQMKDNKIVLNNKDIEKGKIEEEANNIEKEENGVKANLKEKLDYFKTVKDNVPLPKMDKITEKLPRIDKFAERFPRLAKVRNWFREKVSNLKEIYNKEKEYEDKVLEEALNGTAESKPAEEILDEMINDQEIKEEKVETKRDAFIEELRRMAEKDNKEDMAKTYIEKHKAVKKEEKIETVETKKEDDELEI